MIYPERPIANMSALNAFFGTQRLVNAFSIITFIIGVTHFSCTTSRTLAPKDDGKIEISLLHINDVYEISPLEGGKVGGMARVATVRKQYAAKHPTILLHAGDFLSPSVTGTLKYNEKERVRGRQMIEAMNVAGVDLVTFGNHEFDISETEVQLRIDESTFAWVSSNVSHLVAGKPMPWAQRGVNIPPYSIKTFTDADGTSMRIGFFGVTLPSNQQTWLQYNDLTASAKRACDLMRDSVDLMVGITHQEIDEDEEMAKAMQFIPLFIGGHDHNQMEVPVGTTRITKADANAKSLYVHTVRWSRRTGKAEISSKIEQLNSLVALDSATQAVVDKWEVFAQEKFKQLGIDPKARISDLAVPLDGREAVVRGGPSLLGTTCAEALSLAAPKSDFSIFNTGSIRVDDILTGVITEYDVLRILPFGGKIVEVEMHGKLAEQVIKTGAKTNKGKGGYLALDRVAYHPENETVTFQDKPLDATKVYRVAMPEYLVTGKESGLGFLVNTNPDLGQIYIPTEPSDLRMNVQSALIVRLRR